MTIINSVLGKIDSKDLGFTLMHEHVMEAASGLSTGPHRGASFPGVRALVARCASP